MPNVTMTYEYLQSFCISIFFWCLDDVDAFLKAFSGSHLNTFKLCSCFKFISYRVGNFLPQTNVQWPNAFRSRCWDALYHGKNEARVTSLDSMPSLPRAELRLCRTLISAVPQQPPDMTIQVMYSGNSLALCLKTHPFLVVFLCWCEAEKFHIFFLDFTCLLGKWELSSCDNSAKFMVWTSHHDLAFAHLST